VRNKRARHAVQEPLVVAPVGAILIRFSAVGRWRERQQRQAVRYSSGRGRNCSTLPPSQWRELSRYMRRLESSKRQVLTA
jgi:hypothetical protein